ncbi:MAG: hypothetical protein QGH11_00975 [Pirellulaceae bacterium]|nr:hypothetical protein [Pirellulaceae bacterium]
MDDRGNIQNGEIQIPREHGELLVHPAFDELGVLLRDNIRRQQAAESLTLAGHDWQRHARQARHQLVDLARQYSQRYRPDGSLPVIEDSAPIILSGHQPNLIHPGVWFKNFLISRLARDENAIPINLLIDNDTAESGSIQVPSGDSRSPQLASIPYAAWDKPLPYEQWSVVDRQQFSSFAERVTSAGGDWLDQPFLHDFWEHVVEGLQETDNIGQLLARGRHRLEADLGLRTLELPFSATCRFPAFYLFSAMLIEEAGRFRDIYNETLLEYRRAHRIRSRSHPFPELDTDDSWQEIPFWVWTREDPQRRRAFARVSPGEVIIGDREQVQFSLPALPAREEQDVVTAMTRAEQEGIRFRPRALVTTMFSRLMLGDIFVHGVGGARYDQLTDIVIERFLGVQPPGYVVASATFQLPLSLPPVTSDQVNQARQQLRDSEHSPDAYLATLLEEKQVPDAGEIELIRALIDDKQRHVRQQVDPEDRPAWHKQLQQIHQQLALHAAPYSSTLRDRVTHLQEQLDQNENFRARDFSFCLFSRETLFPQLLEFVIKAP